MTRLFTKVDPSIIDKSGGKWIRTSSDNRIVEYSVHGNLDNPNAPILITSYVAEYLLMGDRRTSQFAHGNFKVISVSIPGLGNSDFHPGHKISEWPSTDLEPILKQEKIDGPFSVWGFCLGALYAMSVAQYFGPARVASLGLRVPFLPLSLSQELGLPQGKPTLPTSKEVLQNTFPVKMCRFFMGIAISIMTSSSSLLCYLMKSGLFGSSFASMARLRLDHPKESLYMQRLMENFGVEAMLHAMAKDVVLDCPDVDPRKIKLKSNRIVVWYAKDDDDTPPSHGKWLAEECFPSCKIRAMETGYGHLGGGLLDMSTFYKQLELAATAAAAASAAD